jgi:ppGpp synthetase/RelA/SpoT-type nucleotidyltranferase
LNAKGMEDEAAKSKPEGGEPLKMSSYLSVEKVGDKTQIKFSPDFEKLDAATQKKVLEIAFQSGQRSHLTQAMEKAKGPAKLYYEGQIALLDGDRISAKTKFTQFLEQAKGSEDKAVKALVAQAEGFVESLEQKDVKTPDDVLNDTRKLLGPLVTPLHQGPDGALVLTPEGMKEIATFEDFRKFLATQVSVDGIAFNAVLFANYEKVINDPKHEALLRHLYAQFKPDAKGEAPAMDLAKLQQAFANFQKDVAKVSVSRFVSRHLNSAEGRKKLRALLKDPCLDTSFKLDVIEEIIDVGASEGMTPPHIRALFDKHIGRERTAREILEFASPLHHLASGVSEANAKFEESKIGLATRYGLKVLAEGDRVEFERGLQIDKYENYPHEVQRQNADDYSASVYQIKDRVKLIRSLEKKSDGISQMRTKLAHCWLLVIDNDNWGITRHKDLHQDFVSPAQRAFMARKLDELMREGEEVATNEQFTAWNKKIHDFLNGHGYPDGVEAVNWVRGELGGATVDGFFQGLKPSVAKAYSDLRRYSDEFDAAEDMGMATDVTEPRLQVLDGKRVESSVKLIQDLRGIQRSFWYQYKQRNFLSRAAFSELDKDLIRKANTEIDGIIQAVQDAKTDEDFAAIQQRITRACKEDGAIHKGYAAAEMDGTQHIYNLIQTIAEIVVIEVATGGTASAAAFGRAALTAARIGRATRSLEIGFKVFQTERRIAEAARIARAAEALEMANIGRYGSYAKDVEALEATGALSKADAAAARQMLGLSTRLVQAISTDAGFAAKGYESFKLGVKISTAENLTALLSGQLHEKPKTILDWLKDALSTGGSMVVSAALEPTVAAHLEKNLFKNLWQRWVAQGPKGALHFLGDAGLEVVEEVVDQYVRKKLDGDFRSLSWEEFKDIVLICGFGAAKQGMISHLVSFPKTLRAQKAIEGFHLRGEKVVFDQKSEKNFVVDRNGNIIREATKGEPALFMAYEAETKGEASKGISVFQFESTEKGSKGSLVEVSLAELPIVQPAPQAVTPQKKPAPTAADADRVRAENIQKFKDERTTNLYREFSEGGKVVEKFKKNGAPDGIEVRDAQGNKLRDGTVDELKAFQAYQELIKGFDERGERIIGTPSKGFQLVSKDGKTVIREAKAWEKQLFDQFEKQALFFQKAPEVPRPGVAPGQALPFQLGRQLEEGDSDLGTLDLYKVTIQTAKGPEEVSARLDPEVSKQFGSAEKNLQHALAFIDVNKSYPTANGGSLRFTGAILGQGSASTIYQAVHTTVDPVSGKKIETPVAVKLRTHPRPPRFMGPDAAKYDHGVWEADMLARPHVDDKILKEVSQVDPAYRALGLVRMQGGHEGIMMPHFPHEHCQFFLKLSELPKEDQKIAAPQIKRIADHFMRLGHGLGDVEFVYDRRTKQVHLVDIEGVMLNDAHIAKDKKFMYRFLDVETESPAQDADQLLAASRRAAAPIDVDGKNKPPTPPPPASSGSLSQPGPQPILVTAKGEFLPISFQSGNVVNFSLGGQRVEIIAREGGGHELRLLGPQTTTFQVYDSATKTWTSYNSEVQPGVTLTNGTRVKYGDVEFTWYPSGDSTEARQRVAAPLVQGDFQARVNVHPEAAKNGTAHQAIGRWAIEHPKEYSDFLKGKGILTVRHDGMVFREVNGEPVRRRVLRATEAVLKLGKERGLDKETIKAAAKEAGAHAAFNPSLIGTTAFERIANRFLDEAEMKKIPDPKEIDWLAQTNSPFAAAAQDYKAGKTNPLQYAKAQRAVSQKLIDEHKAAFDDVMGTLKTIANDPTIRASKEHPPIGRMKAVGDIGPKMARREYQDLTPMTDIAATRIIVQNNADVEAVIAKIQEKYKVREVYTKEGDIDVELMNPEAAKEFMKEWGFQPETDVVYVDAKLDKDGIHRLVEGHPASGYRALHVVVEVDGKPVEIQIKTEPMAEWGEIEHKLVYKNKDLPPEVLNPIKEYRKKVADFLAHANEAKAGDKLQAMPIPPDVPIGTPGRDEIQGRLQQMGNLMEKTRAAALQRGALPPG